MSISSVMVLLVLLGVLWLPPLLTALQLGHRPSKSTLGVIGLILPLQIAVAAILCFLARYAGFVNPSRYVPGICVLVGVGGAGALLTWFHFAKPALRAKAIEQAERSAASREPRGQSRFKASQ